MINKNIIENYLKEKNYDLTDNEARGIIVTSNIDEIVIKGSKSNLIEFADYILSVALSENDNDHIHIDDLSLIRGDSDIKSIIIEKY